MVNVIKHKQWKNCEMYQVPVKMWLESFQYLVCCELYQKIIKKQFELLKIQCNINVTRFRSSIIYIQSNFVIRNGLIKNWIGVK